jgi:hypothetical protein
VLNLFVIDAAYCTITPPKTLIQPRSFRIWDLQLPIIVGSIESIMFLRICHSRLIAVGAGAGNAVRRCGFATTTARKADFTHAVSFFPCLSFHNPPHAVRFLCLSWTKPNGQMLTGPALPGHRRGGCRVGSRAAIGYEGGNEHSSC